MQIAKAMGGRVIAVCRGEAKARALTQLGADAVIDTSQQPGTPLRALIKVGVWVPRGLCGAWRRHASSAV